MKRIKKQIKHVTVKPKAKIVEAKKPSDKKPEALIRSFRISGEAAEMADILGIDLNKEVRDAVDNAVGIGNKIDKNRIAYFIYRLQKKLEG